MKSNRSMKPTKSINLPSQSTAMCQLARETFALLVKADQSIKSVRIVKLLDAASNSMAIGFLASGSNLAINQATKFALIQMTVNILFSASTILSAKQFLITRDSSTKASALKRQN